MKRVLLLGLGALLAACSGSASHHTSSQADTTPTRQMCDAAHPEQGLDAIIQVPIVPPRLFGIVDPKGSAWSGLSIDQLNAAFCNGDFQSEDETTVYSAWGPSIVSVEYAKDTHQVQFFQLNAGYLGTLEFASRPRSTDDPTKPNPFGQHHYTVAVGRPILRDGQSWAINWQNFDPQATELLDALIWTYAPELPSTQTSCIGDQLCLARKINDGEGVFGARPLGIYFHVQDMNGEANSPDYIYGFPEKMTPFSVANMTLKIDAEGPIAIAPQLGDKKVDCTVKLGMAYADFEHSCLDIMNDANANATLEDKVFRAATRTVSSTSTAALNATWTLDVTGFHPDFASVRFDEQGPPPTAPVSELVLDIHSGAILNDLPNGNIPRLAGTAAVYGEFARQLQAFAHAKMDPTWPRFGLGDPQCLSDKPAHGCTGFEQMVIPADASAFTDPGMQRLAIGPDAAQDLGIGTVLRPGSADIVFCSDPGTNPDTNNQHCNTNTSSFSGLVESARSQLITVLGGGDETVLPAELLDRTTYVRLWVKSLAKYFIAASQNPIDLGDPKFATPSDADVAVDSVQGTTMSARYKDKLEILIDFLSGNSTKMTFR